MTTKQLNKAIRDLNAVIHHQNLYRIADGARVIYAHRFTDNAGVAGIAVELLSSGHTTVYSDGKFKDGYGAVVNVGWTDPAVR